jgi:hypothetical protein
METAQGPFSSLNSLEMASAPGLPGLSTINELGSNPSYGAGGDAVTDLTTYADEIRHEQALAHATKASRTDMLGSVPTQQYIEDTRNSKWTITNTSQGFAPSGETTAYLSSAQCVDIGTTRLTGSMQISVPAVAAATDADFWTLPPGFPTMLFTNGLQIGANGNTLQDVGTSTDQGWLMQMRLASKPFTDDDVIWEDDIPVLGGTKAAFSYLAGSDNYATTSSMSIPTIKATTTATVYTYSFQMRPTHAFFSIVKTWPPNIPLKLILKWNQSNLIALTTRQGATAGGAPVSAINLRIHTIRSEEIYLKPSMRQYIMNHFATGPATNMNQLAQARTLNDAALYDPTFGIPAYNPANISAIYQFETSRLSTHSVSGNNFQFHPVLNGSARPKRIVIGFPHPNTAYSSSAFPATATYLSSLQILYNGQTVWDEPYIPVADVATTTATGSLLPLFSEVRRHVGDQNNNGVTCGSYYSYQRWTSDAFWIVVKIGPSHNDLEIQPNEAAPVEVRGSFIGTVPTSYNIRVGLFFDQTMLLQKNNTAIFSLPIY